MDGPVTLDTMQNLVSGLLSERDKSLYNQFVTRQLSQQQLLDAYRSDWLARKIIDIPAYDMTREWRAWQAEDDQIEVLEKEEKRLRLRQTVNRALVLARLFGGSCILLGMRRADNPARELDIERVGKDGLLYIHALSRYEISAVELNRDPLSPYFGEPKRYELHSQEGGTVEVHPSRVIRFCGLPPVDWNQSPDGWGDPVLQSVYDAVEHAAVTSQGIASLVQEAKVDVIRVPMLSNHLVNQASTERFSGRFRYANQMKSLINILLLDKEEEWDRKEFAFSGLPDILKLYLQIASGAADIPATRLLGQSPAGLNATGESDIRNYYDSISSKQESELQPALERLDEILIRSALGGRDENIWYEWRPLWQMTEAEKAEIAHKKAQTTQIYANTALIPVDALGKAVANQLIEDQVYPGLEGALEESAREPGEIEVEREELGLEQQKAALEQISNEGAENAPERA